MKILVMILLSSHVMANRISYERIDGHGVSDDDVDLLAELEYEGSGSGESNIIKDGDDQSGMKITIKQDEETENPKNEEVDIDNDEDDGETKTTVREATSTKSGAGHSGNAERILLSVPFGTWLILASYTVIGLLLSVIVCCLVSVRCRMRYLSRMMKTNNELEIVKDRLTLIESKEDESPFQRTVKLPITNSVRKMSAHKSPKDNTKTKNTPFTKEAQKTNRKTSPNTSATPEIREAAKTVDVLADVIEPAESIASAVSDVSIHNEAETPPPPGPFFESEDSIHNT